MRSAGALFNVYCLLLFGSVPCVWGARVAALDWQGIGGFDLASSHEAVEYAPARLVCGQTETSLTSKGNSFTVSGSCTDSPGYASAAFVGLPGGLLASGSASASATTLDIHQTISVPAFGDSVASVSFSDRLTITGGPGFDGYMQLEVDFDIFASNFGQNTICASSSWTLGPKNTYGSCQGYWNSGQHLSHTGFLDGAFLPFNWGEPFDFGVNITTVIGPADRETGYADARFKLLGIRVLDNNMQPVQNYRLMSAEGAPYGTPIPEPCTFLILAVFAGMAAARQLHLSRH